MGIISEIILVRGLSFRYGAQTILKDVNFVVRRGEFVCLTGVNGSGKSTLLKLLLNLLRPCAGHAEILAKSVAYVAQRANGFNPSFPASAEEVVGMGLPGSLNPFPSKKRIRDALAQVDMLAYGNKPIGALSGGQQQRVLLAKALVRQPELIIMDEPTVGIDTRAAGKICCLLAALNRQNDTTLLVVTHDLPLMLNHAHRILRFEDGRLARVAHVLGI